MAEYTEQDIFRSAIDTYGAVMQITVAFEEMSELQKELCKYLRGSGSQENIAEEIADVEIMIEQMKMLFNCETSVLQVREKKVKRLKERMEQNGLDVSENASSKKQLIDANALIKEANADGAYGYVDAKQIADAPTPEENGRMVLTMAEYRKVDGFPYSVSSDGLVRNDRTGRLRKPTVSNSGYLCVKLWDCGKSKNCFIHRLVALAFVPNPGNKPEVNHIDGDKTNNAFSNLEWVTGVENKRHCREVLGKINRNPNTEAANNACKKRVLCIDTGEEYESITSAAKAIGVTQGTLSAHLLGWHHSCKGMKFEYTGGHAS